MFYTLNKVSFSDLCTILRHRASNSDIQSESVAHIPSVHFDVSWLHCKLSSKSSNSPAKDIVTLALQFANVGVRVCLTCDNVDYCHLSKNLLFSMFSNVSNVGSM